MLPVLVVYHCRHPRANRYFDHPGIRENAIKKLASTTASLKSVGWLRVAQAPRGWERRQRLQERGIVRVPYWIYGHGDDGVILKDKSTPAARVTYSNPAPRH